jgi:hypothetical protein
MKIVSRSYKNIVFIHPKTYKYIKYSTKCKESFNFTKYEIIKDVWSPKHQILYFTSEGKMVIKVIKELLNK